MDGSNLSDLRPLSNSNPSLPIQTSHWQANNYSSASVSRPHSYSEAVPNMNAPSTPHTPIMPSPTSQPLPPQARPPAITLDTRYTMSTDSNTSSSSTREDFTILAKEGKLLIYLL